MLKRSSFPTIRSAAWLRCAAPGLRFNLPDALAICKRVREGTSPNDSLALDRDSELS